MTAATIAVAMPAVPAQGQAQITGKLAYAREGSILTAYADGSLSVPITSPPSGADVEPAWSPDGSRIAFASDRAGNGDIYLMDSNGANLIRLTNDPATDGAPAWSPDGTEIAFESNRGGNFDIYILRVSDTSVVRQLTSSAADDRWPSWSPDGSTIAFSSNRDGNFEIYTVGAADGSDPTRLTTSSVDDLNPAWSPSGDEIAWNTGEIFSQDQCVRPLLMVMSAAGQDQRLVYQDGVEPAWSADGSTIAFRYDQPTVYCARGRKSEIESVPASGGSATLLVPTPNHSPQPTSPAWQVLPAAPQDDEVTITIAVDHPTVPYGGATVTYTLTVKAVSGPATDVVVADESGTGETFVSASSSLGTCDGGSIVLCRFASLAEGDSTTIHVSASIDPTWTDPVPNHAFVQSAERDRFPQNNEDVISVFPEVADVGLWLSASPNPVSEGSALTYQFTVYSQAKLLVPGVTLTDALPSGAMFQSASASQGSCSGTTTVTCILGRMRKQGGATVTLVVIPQSGGTMTNSATVSSPYYDPRPDGNSASATVRVGPPGCTIWGTDGNDRLRGTAGNDVICGLNGDDVINGVGGQDTIYAGYGKDTVYGGPGADWIAGGPGDDLLYGEGGNDSIFGGSGYDSLDGGDGTDSCDIGPDGGVTTNCES